MNPRLQGNLLVIGQFVLLGLLILVPPGLLSFSGMALWISLTSQIILYLGLIVLGFGLVGLGSALTAHPIPNKKAKLVTTGIYRYIRHPIYTGLMIAGISLTLNGGLFPHGLFLVALIGLLNYKARFEEGLLQLRFPSYSAYAAKTGRFLPRLKG
ncbi:MAG: methyltransferase family protein [Actinomycetota bacterium]